MKINIRENEIKGDVQDGSVDLVQEFEEKLHTIRRELDGWPEPVLPDIFGDEIHKVGIRISFDFDGGEKIIRWQLKGYFKESPEKPINFVIPKDIIANGYRALVDFIKTTQPDLMSYPEEVLSQYEIKAWDFDVFTDNGIIPGRYFFRGSEEHDYESMFDKQYPLVDFLNNVDTIAQSYVLPYEFKFGDKYSNRYYFSLKKGKQIAKAYLSGTFEGHEYRFKESRVTVSPAYKAFNTETKVLENKYHVSVDYSLGIYIDGDDYTEDINKHLYDRETLEFAPGYRRDLINKLKPIFKGYGLEVS
jgi:hypothetical protein